MTDAKEFHRDAQRRRELSACCRQFGGRLLQDNRGYVFPTAGALLAATEHLIEFDRRPTGDNPHAIWFGAVPIGGEVPVPIPPGDREILDAGKWRWK